jgi:hypothetical protein
MAEGKIRPLLEMAAEFEPLILGERLDTLDSSLVDAFAMINQLRRDLEELRERVLMVAGPPNKI